MYGNINGAVKAAIKPHAAADAAYATAWNSPAPAATNGAMGAVSGAMGTAGATIAAGSKAGTPLSQTGKPAQQVAPGTSATMPTIAPVAAKQTLQPATNATDEYASAWNGQPVAQVRQAPQLRNPGMENLE